MSPTSYRTLRPRARRGLLVAAALVLAGCSSGNGDGASGTSASASDGSRSGGASGNTTGKPDPNDPGGNFRTAGRVSANFGGAFPNVTVALGNPTDQQYQGTASFRDCTGSNGAWTTRPANVRVTLAAGAKGEEFTVIFPPDHNKPAIAEHRICMRLTDRDSELSGTVKSLDQPNTDNPSPDNGDGSRSPSSTGGGVTKSPHPTTTSVPPPASTPPA